MKAAKLNIDCELPVFSGSLEWGRRKDPTMVRVGVGVGVGVGGMVRVKFTTK